MTAWINGAKLVFLALFLAAAIGMTAYDAFYVWPARKCESGGDWWDARDRACLTPIPVWRLTGRPPGPQRVAPGAQSTSPSGLAARAATNSRSDSRLR